MQTGEVINLFKARSDRDHLDANKVAFAREIFRSTLISEIDGALRCHPLGFCYTTLQLDDKHTLRFHIWLSKWKMPDDQAGAEIHDHIFELNSIVLCGSLEQEIYKFTPSPSGRYQLLETSYGGTASKLQLSEVRGNLDVEISEEIKSGCYYRLPAGAVHQTWPKQLPAATLVLAVTEDGSAKPRVFCDRNIQPPQQFDRRKLFPEECDEIRSIIAQF